MAAIANLFIDQGSTFSTSVNVKNDDETASTATDFTVSIADPPSNGQIDCQLTATQTAALEEGRYVYDVEVTSDTGTVTRVIEGIITINPNVTK